jgi:hypothetical protein
MMDYEVQELYCLDRGSDGEGCDGEVQFRTALTATAVSYPRCDFHWERRLDKEEENRRDYPDSDVPPSWFDPFAAGERWEDD